MGLNRRVFQKLFSVSFEKIVEYQLSLALGRTENKSPGESDLVETGKRQ